MPLTMAKQGEAREIKKINGRDDIKRFLESLGFVTGCVITIVSEMNGNLIVNIKNTRVAISKTMALRIII